MTVRASQGLMAEQYATEMSPEFISAGTDAVTIEAWRRHYNAVRPHSSLKHMTPHEFKRHNPVHPDRANGSKNSSRSAALSGIQLHA